MNICFGYSLKWRYEFNHSKSGIVVFGESKPEHYNNIKEHTWILGTHPVSELYEYKNLGVTKNCFQSFASNIDDNIEKTRNKAGMIFSAKFDRRKTNPLIFVKFWKQACIPSLLFGAELFTINPTLLLRLERCQTWFLRKIFFVPNYAPNLLLLNLAGLNSV